MGKEEVEYQGNSTSEMMSLSGRDIAKVPLNVRRFKTTVHELSALVRYPMKQNEHQPY